MYVTAKGLQLFTSAQTNNNIITGAAGSVRLGTIKNDMLNSLSGDTLSGGLGDDSYNLWDATSKIVEKAGEGVDTAYVNYWGGYKMADGLENLVLLSKGANWATGNALNNVITAGTTGATLDGGAGDDVLVGGAGADLFTVTKGNGSDALVNFRPGWDVVKLDGYGVTSFAQLQKLATQVGSDVSIKVSGSETLVIRDVKLSALSAADFNLPMDPVTPVTADKVLTTHTAWNANGWYVVNNDWNVAGLTRGKDYTLTSAFNTHDMTDGTTFTWSFPLVTGVSPTVRAFPEMIFGSSPLNTAGADPTDFAHVFPVRVSDLKGLTAAHDVSYAGNTGGFNVSYDIFLSGSETATGKSAVSNEVMVWVHKPDFAAFGDVVGHYSKDGFNATIYHTGTYTAVVADKDMPVGTIDIADILQTLKGLGIVNGGEYLRSVELGAEVVSGAGTLKVNDLTLQVSTADGQGGTLVKTVTGAGTSVVDVNPVKAAIAGIKAAAATPLVDGHGRAVGTQTMTDDSSGITVTRNDMAHQSLGRDVVVQDGNRVTTQHYSGANVLLGTDRSDYADGKVSTQHLDAAGRFVAGEIVTTDAKGTVTDHHYDAKWAFTGAERTVGNADGSTTVQHYDAAWALLSADKTTTAGNKVTVQHYDAGYAFAGADTTIATKDGSTTLEHYDKNWKMTGSDLIKATVDGVTKTYHYDGKYALTGSETATLGADGVTKTLIYDKAYKLVDTSLTGTDRVDTLSGSSGTTQFHGGLGSDVLTGGAGVDRFYFDTAIGQGDVDTINGFKAANDKIVLDHHIFDQLGKAGSLDAAMFVVGATARDANDHLLFDKVKGDLYYDADGLGGHDGVLIAHLGTDVALTAANFVVM